MIVAIVIIAILLAAGISVVLFANRARSSTGTLSRETVKRDTSAPGAEAAPSTSTELEAAGRERSDETRETMGGVPATRRRGEVVEYEPVDEEELGVTRRHFFNVALLSVVGLSVASFGTACLAFLWPLQGLGGFGGTVNVGKLSDILAGIASYPGIFYASAARAYIVRYPQDPVDLAKAKKVYKPAIYKDMSELGLVALYQRCVHLGCRVPFCKSSQWFECPCHGSKYNQAGEYELGPAPNGLQRFPVKIENGSLLVDTGTLNPGPPRGTDTIHEPPQGPFCVAPG